MDSHVLWAVLLFFSLQLLKHWSAAHLTASEFSSCHWCRWARLYQINLTQEDVLMQQGKLCATSKIMFSHSKTITVQPASQRLKTQMCLGSIVSPRLSTSKTPERGCVGFMIKNMHLFNLSPTQILWFVLCSEKATRAHGHMSGHRVEE